MSINKSEAIHAVTMRLFRDQAVTISKTNDSVTIGCKNSSEANDVFEWLCQITGQYGSVEEWLDEIESFSMRRERLDDLGIMEPWLKSAFDAGRGV